MTDHTERDDPLHAEFALLKKSDAMRAPAFGTMLQQAKLAAAAVPAEPARTMVVHRSRRRFVVWGGPILLAAGLSALWVMPRRAADREFDRLVTEWSETTRSARHSPTDALLALPGSEFLGRMPAVGNAPGGRS